MSSELSKYQILCKLGSGGYSDTWRAKIKATGVNVAIKVVTHDGDSKHELFIKREMETLMQVKHPHIVQLFEAIDAQKHLYFVMELLEGGELLDIVNARAPFPDKEAAGVTKQITSAVAYLHSVGIVHRDLKLENVLCTTKGTSEVKLVDFGFARIVEGTLMDSAVGTDSYMAPEIIQGLKYTSAVDLWSLGVVVFAMLSGTLPFSSDDPTICVNMIRTCNYTWQNDLEVQPTSFAKDFIRKTLELDPSKRWTAQQCLQHIWIRDL